MSASIGFLKLTKLFPEIDETLVDYFYMKNYSNSEITIDDLMMIREFHVPKSKKSAFRQIQQKFLKKTKISKFDSSSVKSSSGIESYDPYQTSNSMSKTDFSFPKYAFSKSSMYSSTGANSVFRLDSVMSDSIRTASSSLKTEESPGNELETAINRVSVNNHEGIRHKFRGNHLSSTSTNTTALSTRTKSISKSLTERANFEIVDIFEDDKFEDEKFSVDSVRSNDSVHDVEMEIPVKSKSKISSQSLSEVSAKKCQNSKLLRHSNLLPLPVSGVCFTPDMIMFVNNQDDKLKIPERSPVFAPLVPTNFRQPSADQGGFRRFSNTCSNQNTMII